MLILRACLLWAVISANIVGTAFLFRRIFPRESPWLAFLVPEILLTLVCNFIEHSVALPAMAWASLLTTFGSLWCIGQMRDQWRAMRLSTLLFLGAFAFTLTLRMLRPSISDTRDGIADLGLIANFCFGQTLPVESTWLPPVKMLYYYCLPHYGGALLIRLFGLDMGTGYNLCAALLSAYIYFLAGAIAWHLSRGKLWITVLSVALVGCAAAGSTLFLKFSLKEPQPEDLANIFIPRGDTHTQAWLWKYVTPIDDFYARHELFVPGYWSWTGAFHSSAVGQLWIEFAILSLIEMVRPRRSNWPWICAAISSLLMLTSCSWGLPMTGLLFLGGLFICWRRKLLPAQPVFAAGASVFLLLSLEPMLSYFLLWPRPEMTWATGLHTQVIEFLVQWWPVLILWLPLIFIWKRLHPVVRLVIILAPIFFALVETVNVGQRYDMTGKTWGMIYCAAWITLFPAVAAQRGLFFRLILVALLFFNAISLDFWIDYYWRVAPKEDIAHLEGSGPLRWDDRKAAILESVSQLHDTIIFPGKAGWIGTENTLVAELSGNRTWETWSVICDFGFYTNAQGEADRRAPIVNDFYDGKDPDPLALLRRNNISAVVIYPDDDVPDAVLAKLTEQLSPYYIYESFRNGQPDNAGVFIYSPASVELQAARAKP